MKDPTHLFEGQISDKQRKAAKIISFIGQPTLLAIPVFILLNLVADNLVDFALCTAICLIMAVIVPTEIVYYFSFKYNNDDGDIVRREDRVLPLILGTLSYVLATIMLWVVSAPRIVTLLMLCYAIVTTAVLIISMYWKISIHSTGVIGPSIALTFTFPPYGILFILFWPPIVWSRYVLGKHSPAQLVGGAVLGFMLTFLIFWIFL